MPYAPARRAPLPPTMTATPPPPRRRLLFATLLALSCVPYALPNDERPTLYRFKTREEVEAAQARRRNARFLHTDPTQVWWEEGDGC